MLKKYMFLKNSKYGIYYSIFAHANKLNIE
jgi:hypothetical protein